MRQLLLDTHSLGVQHSTQPRQALSFINTVIGSEFIIVSLMLCFVVVRAVLVFIYINRFYRDEYLGTWSLLYHGVIGPELAVEDFWRPLYKKPTVFGAIKYPALSKTLELHLRFLISFLEALRDLAKGPLKVFYIHWLAGHGRLQRFRMRKFWILIALYPLLVVYPLWQIQQLSWYWIILGYVGFLLLMTSAILFGDGTLELQYRARMRALCEFLLDEGGPDPLTLPPPPEILGSPMRQRWVKLFERVARWFNWRGGTEE